MTASFGFAISTPGPIQTFYGSNHSEYWSVELPHQCDEWTITFTTDRAQAIAEMEAFISQAQQALEQLRDTPETPRPPAE